jgi:enoyl-CoA hydratase/carnithine racemase
VTDAIGPLVRTEHEGRVARVVIGSGMRRNALRSSGWVAIERTVQRLAADDVLRAVIIEGAGGWLCAGSDIREWARATSAQVALRSLASPARVAARAAASKPAVSDEDFRRRVNAFVQGRRPRAVSLAT